MRSIRGILVFIISFYAIYSQGANCSDIVSDGYNLRDTNYYCSTTLVVPSGVTLTSRDLTRRGRIIAASNFDSSQPLIRLERNSSLIGVIANGAFRAKIIVRVAPNIVNSLIENKSGLDNDEYGMVINDNVIINAYNGSRNYPLPSMATSRTDVAGIWVKAGGSTGYIQRLHIEKNHIYNIGFKSSGENQGKIHPLDWESRGHAIYMRGVVEAHVENNIISHTLSGGINFGGCRDILVKGNEIDMTGLNRVYGASAGSVSDGITAYKNRQSIYSGLYASGKNENYRILHNTIERSYNNGIHVSRNNITLKHNTVTGQLYRGIYYGHWNEGGTIQEDPMENASIKYNKVTYGSSGGRYSGAIFVRTPPTGRINVQIKYNKILD